MGESKYNRFYCGQWKHDHALHHDRVARKYETLVFSPVGSSFVVHATCMVRRTQPGDMCTTAGPWWITSWLGHGNYPAEVFAGPSYSYKEAVVRLKVLS